MKHIKKIQPHKLLEQTHGQKSASQLEQNTSKLEQKRGSLWHTTPVGLKCIPSGNPPDRD